MPFDLVARPLAFAAALSLAAPSLAPAAAAPEGETHPAPAAAHADAPAEAELMPSPDAEKVPSQRTQIRHVENPAFPRPVVEQVVELGRRYDSSDVAPYFSDGPLKDARAAFDRGHYAHVRTLLRDQGNALPVRYLRALAAVRAEAWDAASEEMAALAEDYPAMRDRCLTHGGLSFEALKRYDRAAELLAQVPRDSKMFSDARLGLFRSLRSAGRYDEAVQALAPLAELPAPSWGRDVGAEALFALAELQKGRNKPDLERDALQRLWAQHPLSPLSTQVEKRLDLSKLPLERHVDRAEALVDAHRNRRGIDHLRPLLGKLQLPDPLACRAHFVFGKAMRKEREHKNAIAALAPVVENCLDPELRPRALYVLASSRSIIDQGAGPATYETLARDYPEHSFADDALYFAADVLLGTGNQEAALARLAELAQKYPTGDFAAEGLFKSFWIRRKRGEVQQAYALLDQIERTFATSPESYEVERARYWRARMLEGEGNKREAAKLLAQLATDHPATYYGLISRRRLPSLDTAKALAVSRSLTFPATAEAWPLHAGTLAEDPHFLAGVELLRLGFPEAVTSELLAANRTRAHAESIRLLVQLLSAAGDARAAHAVARTSLRGDLSGRITAHTRPVWEVAYPRAFRELIEKHCKSVGLQPDLLQALMREESALDPKALSWAGALGLTQLMPYTAKAVARELKIRNVTNDRLLEPDLNIRIGAAYLGGLVKRFDGTYEYALAGYNAGGGAVSRWRRERPTLELDEWVEEIPISETRGYVKRVLRSYNTYQLLYPEPATEVSEARPRQR